MNATLLIGGLGPTELIIILVIVLLIFGPGRLGSMGEALGKGIHNFKKAVRGKEDLEVEARAEAPASPTALPPKAEASPPSQPQVVEAQEVPAADEKPSSDT